MEEQTFLGLLEASGIQVRQALDRFMGNEDLYLSFLAKLPGQLHFEDILRALGEEDEEAFYLGVHNLKPGGQPGPHAHSRLCPGHPGGVPGVPVPTQEQVDRAHLGGQAGERARRGAD